MLVVSSKPTYVARFSAELASSAFTIKNDWLRVYQPVEPRSYR